MAKKEQDSQTTKPLTEWQKRNLEFLQKKQENDLQTEKKHHQEMLKRNPHLDEEQDDRIYDTSQAVEKTERTKKPRLRGVSISIKRNKIKKEKTIAASQRRMVGAIVSLSTLAILFSLFLISPWSKEKVLTVSGNKNALAADIETASGIKATDYLTHIFFNRSQFAQNVKANNVWIQKASISYHFPNHFTIAVKEYPIVAYRQTNNGYVSILEIGKSGGTVSSNNLPEHFITINLEKEEQVKSVIDQLNKVDKSIKNDIRIISLTPTKASNDLLTLEMYDGNIIRVPLSQLSTKLPYYNQIKDQQNGNTIFDMEVGIYTTSSEIESQPSKEEEKDKPESETTSETSTDQEENVTPTENTVDETVAPAEENSGMNTWVQPQQ